MFKATSLGDLLQYCPTVPVGKFIKCALTTSPGTSDSHHICLCCLLNCLSRGCVLPVGPCHQISLSTKGRTLPGIIAFHVMDSVNHHGDGFRIPSHPSSVSERQSACLALQLPQKPLDTYSGKLPLLSNLCEW